MIISYLWVSILFSELWMLDFISFSFLIFLFIYYLFVFLFI